MIFESPPEPRGYVPHGSVTVSQTSPPEGLMVMCIPQPYPPLAFPRDFSWLPESFRNTMNCGWWKTKIICNIALWNIVFETTDSSLSRLTLAQSGGELKKTRCKIQLCQLDWLQTWAGQAECVLVNQRVLVASSLSELVAGQPAIEKHSLSWSNHVKLGSGLNWSTS